RLSDGGMGHVTVTVPSHPDVRAAELDIPFRYDVKFTANFSGSSGMQGSDGINGIDGSSGMMGSLDPNHPSAGGNGSGRITKYVISKCSATRMLPLELVLKPFIARSRIL